MICTVVYFGPEIFVITKFFFLVISYPYVFHLQ